jgi:hypothetical protein
MKGVECTSEMAAPIRQKEAGRRDHKLPLGSKSYRGLVFVTFLMFKHNWV